MKRAMDNTNKETIFDELNNFEKKKLQDVTPLLEEYLGLIAKTGNTIFPWMKLRPLFRHKMDKVITEFNVAFPANDLPQSANLEKFDFEDMHGRLLRAVDDFSGTPFTIQRLCELVISPYKQYKRADKFMRALEKDLLVVSTIDPVNQRNKTDADLSLLVNGVTVSTTSVNGTTDSPHHSSSSSDDGSTNTDESSKGSVTTSDDMTQSSSNSSADSTQEPMESDLTLEAGNPVPDSSSKLTDAVEAPSSKASSEAMIHRQVSEVTEKPEKEMGAVIEESPSTSISSEPIVDEPDEPAPDDACEEQHKGSEGLSIEELPSESEPSSETDADVSADMSEQKVECPESEEIRNADAFSPAEFDDSSVLPTTTTSESVTASTEEVSTLDSAGDVEVVAVSMDSESENTVESSVPTTPMDDTPTEVEKMEQD